MSSIRFIHAADLHLDSPFKGMSSLPEARLKDLRNSTFIAFDKLIQYAIDEQPDFVLIVGDIYDGEDRSLRAQSRFQKGMEKLAEKNIPVILSHGNHDHLRGKWTRFQLPSNVHVLPKKVDRVKLTIRDTEVNVYGFSYKDRHITESMIEGYPVANNPHAYHIGMLHGSLMGNTTHDVYAPFTKEELLSKQYQYWALGHIHLRQILHEEPPIVYPGNIQSRHRNEKGVKGFYEVTLDGAQSQLTFVPTSAIVYDELTVNCQGVMHANELLQVIEESIEQFRFTVGAGVIELDLVSLDQEAYSLLESSSMDEWLETIREKEEMKEPSIWVQSIRVNEQSTFHYEPTVATEAVLKAIDHWDEIEWKTVLKDLYQNSRGSRFFDALSEEDIENIKEQAQTLFKKEMAVKE